MDPYFARKHRLNCVLCCDPQFTSCMIHKKESSVGALLEFYPQKRKTTAAITSAQTKKVSRELGSAGSFARLLPSKICTRPSAVHASDGKILCPFPSLTTVHRAAQPSGKEGEESQTLLLLSSHVSRKTATGRSLALVSCHDATGPILLLNRPHSMSGLVYTSSASEEKQSPLLESDITLRRSAPYNQIDNIRAYDSVNNVRKNVRKRGDGVFSNRWHRKKRRR